MNAKRIALIVTGALAALLASALVFGGGLALYGDSQKDGDGYLSTTPTASRPRRGHSPPRTSTWISATPTGSSRRTTSATSEYRRSHAASKPVFVGIARTSDVESYLSGVSYTTLTT